MKEIIIIVAIAKNNAIGKDNKLLWHILEDLKRFKKLTKGHPIIMGKNTFLSLPVKPLPQRTNIVVSTTLNTTENVVVKKTLEEAIDFSLLQSDKVYIIGGESIYKQVLEKNLATKLEITLVDKDYEGDVFFPKIDLDIWEEIFLEQHNGFSFITYIKKELKK